MSKRNARHWLRCPGGVIRNILLPLSLTALLTGLGLFIASETREPQFASAETLEAEITSTTRGRLYTQRDKSCEAFFVCSDVVAVSGVCLGSQPIDNRLLQFKALPLGEAPQAQGIRTEHYLAKSSLHDVALVKLDRKYENIHPEWNTRIPSDGFESRRWIEAKAKEYCGTPSKELFVKAYPGTPGEVSGHIASQPQAFLVDCQGAGLDDPASCHNHVLNRDKVALLAKNPSNKTIEFSHWDSFQDTECPCAIRPKQSQSCAFEVDEVQSAKIGCVAVYKGFGVTPPTSRPVVPTVVQGAKNRPITASFPILPIPGSIEPGRHLGLNSDTEDDE